MGYVVNKQIEVSVFINEKEYPLDKINSLNFVHISSTVITKVPTLSLGITDTSNLLPVLGLQDGIPIRVTIKAFDSPTKTYRFRKFNHTRQVSSGANQYTISGYYDSPSYWATTSHQGIQGSSNDALSKIAGACGLKYDGTPTNDNQLWLPQNQSYSVFARNTAEYGYIDDTSCMALGLDLDGTLLYRNINDLKGPRFNLGMYQGDEGTIIAVDMRIISSSGLNNVLSGYQNVRYSQSLVRDALIKTDSLEFKRNTKNPELNMVLKDKVGRGQVRFAPVDCGNVHEQFEKASYQNARYKNTFSQSMEVLVIQPTDVRFFDVIGVTARKEDTSKDEANSGLYIVSGKAIYLQGTTYSEKFLLTRHGDNSKQVQG